MNAAEAKARREATCGHARIVEEQDWYRAVCDCGWTSYRPEPTRPAARRHLRVHKAVKA